MVRAVTAIACLVAAVSLVQAQGTQTPPPPQDQRPPVFRGRVETVAVPVTVFDPENTLVTALSRDDFTIFDNEKRQEITQFSSGLQPIRAVVLVDSSASMMPVIDLALTAAEQFVIRLLPEDRAKIGSFSDKILFGPKQGLPFTNNRDELVRILQTEIQFGNPTRLWDAVLLSMAELSEEPGRRVVLVFTDGDDNASQLAGRGDLVDRALAENFMIYGIGYRSRFFDGRSWVTTRPDRGLRPLTMQSGGGYFELTAADELGPTFTRIADELHRQYVLGFSPEVMDGKVHKLEVKVKVAGATVRARQSYLANPSVPSPDAPAAAGSAGR